MFGRRQPRPRHVVVIGSGHRARLAASRLETEAEVIGFLDDDPDPRDREELGERYLGSISELRNIACGRPLSEVVLAVPRRFLASTAIANLVATCEILALDVTVLTDLFESRIARAQPGRVPGVPAVTLTTRRHLRPWKLRIKRVLDVAIAAGAIVFTLPVWIAASLAIRLDSRGPVLFVQERLGQHGRPFRMYKFRTMVVDAEKHLEDLRARNEQTGPVFKIDADPRITRAGALLRRYSIDELPQLLNVLRGEMSIVGPRPPLASEVVHYQADHRGRLSMRPGLTCLWQISGRNQIAFEDWVKLDLEYVQRWSLLLDLRILFATIPAVLRGRGAS